MRSEQWQLGLFVGGGLCWYGVGAPNAIAWIWLELAKCNVLSVGARCGERFKVVRVEV